MRNSTQTVAIISGVLLAIATAANALAADLPAPLIAVVNEILPVTPTQRIELFNGKDFSGWTFCLASNAAPANTFAVTNGLIHCTGQPFGYVRSSVTYQDYKLTVEWRFVKPVPRADNSGVFVHVQTPDKVWPLCFENQGQFHHQGDIILMGGAKSTSHQGNGIQSEKMKQPQNENAGGEWNTYEIVCQGNTIKNFVNGKLMNEIEGCNASSGAVALQSEGGEWEARKVFIEPLK